MLLMIVGGLVKPLIGVVLGSIFLRSAAVWIDDEEISDLEAIATLSVAGAILLPIALVVGIISGAAGVTEEQLPLIQILMAGAAMVVLALVVSRRHNISGAKSLLISVVMLVFGFILMAIVLIAVLILGGMLGY